jgi:oxygen-dependent protoporphyrinogen oxidase
MLLSPAKAGPILASSIFSPWGKLRMGLEYFIAKRDYSEADDESLADFVRRRLGREALERLIQPLVGGIYTSDPERLSLKATLPRFIEQEQRYGSLIRAARSELADKSKRGDLSGGGARYSLFATFKDGISELFNTLQARVEAGGQLQFNTLVDRVQRLDNGRVKLFSRDNELGEFDGVLIALPAFRAAKLIKSLSLSATSDLTTALEDIEYASTAIVVSGHKLEDIQHPLNSFGLVIPAIERRRILAVSFSSRKFVGRAPEGRVILRTFVGGAMQPEQLDQPDERIEAIVQDELRDILGVRGKPDFMLTARHNQSMPQYYVGHLERVRRINEGMRHLPGIELAGNAYTGVGLPDCIESAEQAAARLFQRATAESPQN